MNNYIVVVVEGKTLKELNNNLDAVLSEILAYDVSYEIKGNDIILETNGLEGRKFLTITASVYDIGTCYILILPIDTMKTVLFFKYDGNFIDQGKILSLPPLKSIIFIANKETLFGAINTIAYSIVNEYKKNFEETGAEFNPDILPIYIENVESYKIPVKIYDHFHIVYDKILATLRKIDTKP